MITRMAAKKKPETMIQAVRCDMPVEVVFHKLNDDITLPLFRPAN